MTRYLLPHPLSVNHLYGERSGPGRRRYLKPEGRAFHAEVQAVVLTTKRDHDPRKPSRYRVSFEARPPDHRRRDSHNLLKLLFDALVSAGAIWDDCDDAVRDVRLRIGEPCVGGMVVVDIEDWEPKGEGNG